LWIFPPAGAYETFSGVTYIEAGWGREGLLGEMGDRGGKDWEGRKRVASASKLTISVPKLAWTRRKWGKKRVKEKKGEKKG